MSISEGDPMRVAPSTSRQSTKGLVSYIHIYVYIHRNRKVNKFIRHLYDTHQYKTQYFTCGVYIYIYIYFVFFTCMYIYIHIYKYMKKQCGQIYIYIQIQSISTYKSCYIINHIYIYICIYIYIFTSRIYVFTDWRPCWSETISPVFSSFKRQVLAKQSIVCISFR